MSAEGQIKAFIDRILRLKEEQDVIGDDIRDIYAEAKGMGFDKTAMGNVVAHLRKIAKKGSETVAEQGAIFDIYLAAYEGSHAPAPARVRENIEKFDPLTGEILDDAPRADGGANIVTRHTEIATNEGGANQEDDVAQGSVPDLEPSGPDVNGQPNSPEEATKQRVNVHSQHEGANAQAIVRNECVTVVGTESGTVAQFTAKPPSPLRPHCRQPEACGGYGRNHCHTCAKAMREREPAEELA